MQAGGLGFERMGLKRLSQKVPTGPFAIANGHRKISKKFSVGPFFVPSKKSQIIFT